MEDMTPDFARDHTTPWVFDGHNDLPWEARDKASYDWDSFDIGSGRDDVHTDVPRLRAGGVGAQFWSVFVPGTLPAGDAVIATLEQVDGVRRMIERWPGVFAPATGADQVRRARRDGRIASLMGAEGGHSIGGSLGVLRQLHDLGVRYLTLTHNQNVGWADSATDDPDCGGLSGFGRDVVGEMNRLGMIVDLSHTAETTMRAALDVSSAPVIFSHSSAKAVCDHPRNVPDDVLVRMAEGDGVCMVTFVPSFVSPTVAAWERDVKERARAGGVDPHDWVAMTAWVREHAPDRPTATLDDVVAHVEHVREIAGIDHVGVGGDYDGTDALPEGLADVSCYPRLFDALAARGWSRRDLDKLAGENVLRVLGDVEDVAQHA